jgi:hypothetical protein
VRGYRTGRQSVAKQRERILSSISAKSATVKDTAG